ncbi:ribonuclease P protein component [Thalassobius sp. Cn5-15]|uniref:ribonuclease P protein component n=1 Tax=Thalassobius sp. Cn5-15 TaxID=2917763 RepID=UPI00351D892B
MTPPEAPMTGDSADMGKTPPAVSVCLTVLKNRSDFLRAAKARRQGTGGMMVQARKRQPEEAATGVRVGFTCSKKVGNAVARNRAKRRMREVARLVLPEHGLPDYDYVLIGRAEATAQRPFDQLQGDLIYALKRLHQPPPPRGEGDKAKRPHNRPHKWKPQTS